MWYVVCFLYPNFSNLDINRAEFDGYCEGELIKVQYADFMSLGSLFSQLLFVPFFWECHFTKSW